MATDGGGQWRQIVANDGCRRWWVVAHRGWWWWLSATDDGGRDRMVAADSGG